MAMLREADNTKAPDREDGLIILNFRILQLERNQKFSGENYVLEVKWLVQKHEAETR